MSSFFLFLSLFFWEKRKTLSSLVPEWEELDHFTGEKLTNLFHCFEERKMCPFIEKLGGKTSYSRSENFVLLFQNRSFHFVNNKMNFIFSLKKEIIVFLSFCGSRTTSLPFRECKGLSPSLPRREPVPLLKGSKKFVLSPSLMKRTQFFLSLEEKTFIHSRRKKRIKKICSFFF